MSKFHHVYKLVSEDGELKIDWTGSQLTPELFDELIDRVRSEYSELGGEPEGEGDKARKLSETNPEKMNQKQFETWRSMKKEA